MPPAEESIDIETYSGRFAFRLRELRKKSGMSVDEILERMNKLNNTTRKVPKRSGYYSWEHAEGLPHLDLLPVIVKTYKLKSVHELMPKK